jgi:hypothetical protein
MNCVDPLGIEKNPFGQGRLARIDMSADTDISNSGYFFVHY